MSGESGEHGVSEAVTFSFFCSFSSFSRSAFMRVAICCTGWLAKAQLNCQRMSCTIDGSSTFLSKLSRNCRTVAQGNQSHSQASPGE